MREEGVDVLFLGLSSDLEYLSGVERGIPFFGQSSYPHGWVAGGFFRQDAEPVFVLPRMVVVFDLPVRPDGEIVVVDETDDGRAVFERVAKGLGPAASVAVGDRVWAETAIELGRIFGLERLRTGSTLVNRLRRVKTGEELDAMARACRTVETAMAAVTPRVRPGVTMAELREEVEAQLRAACRPGALARDVNAACRAPIEEAGLGEHFRHRMGHGIGLDVHERPFLSPEDETPLEAGMTFTDEPSMMVPGAFGMRIENIVVCADGGARVLNDFPNALVTNP
jgi:Xaa-Pro aminopeptidase